MEFDPIWLIDYIGYYGSFFVVSLVFLRLFLLKKFLYSVIFLFGAFFNLEIDLLFKAIFRDPRPRDPVSMVLPSWSWFQTGRLTNDNSLYEGVIKYGFPSGHAQSVFYGTGYLYMMQGGKWNIWLALCFLVCLFTVCQRYKYRRHTIEQLIAGSLLGWFVGFTVYWITKKIKNGELV